MYKWIALGPKVDLAAQLKSVISPEYDPERVAKKLVDSISTAVKAILVEEKYIDKDYRSTYYHFYSKKGRHYGLDCVRLHFFDGTVVFNEEGLN